MPSDPNKSQTASILTEEDRRLPYFYSHFNGVKCPACAESILERAPSEAANMAAYYFTDRLLRCDNCLIYIGPEPHETGGESDARQA